jgi:hypothetical protein
MVCGVFLLLELGGYRHPDRISGEHTAGTKLLWDDTSSLHGLQVAPFSLLTIYPLGPSRVSISAVKGWTFLSGFATVG